MINNDQSSYDDLNEILNEQYAEIELLSGDITNGFNVNIGIDSTSWFETKNTGKEQVKTDVVRTVSTMDIIKIDAGNVGQGARKGIENGFVFGAVAGVGLILAQLYLDSTSVGFKSLLFIPVCAVGGVVIGIPYGMISKGKQEYILKKTPTGSTFPTVPLNEKEVIAEAGSPVMQSDGFYHIEVSSVKVDQEYYIVTWRDKDIRLLRYKVKQWRKSGNKDQLVISPDLYKEKFK